eukprot:CAMPEP_0172179128 /NCGR_PEP_ID=MMETSP1050-20130122/16435_1 /TAXON_ID=233186 /ORGANISM="Cryptomonas curvata, Strain CCAP979/52" /LENGTH=409 /DNA_ID=CAMNT_0012851955 /DNA_START=52 /DNA_END=1278 /DNA_ORIENTATION=-
MALNVRLSNSNKTSTLRHGLSLIVSLFMALLAVSTLRHIPSELATDFDDDAQSVYRMPRDTEVVDDPPTGWAYTVHVQRDSDGNIERIDVPSNAVVKRAADGWNVVLPKSVPRDLYDSNYYLPRGNHLYKNQFNDKQWAEKKLLEKFFRADNGQTADFEDHGLHDLDDDWDRIEESKSKVAPIFGGVRDCEDIDCYLKRVNGESDARSVPQASIRRKFSDVDDGAKLLPTVDTQSKPVAEDTASEGCGVSCLISFLTNAVATTKPRFAKQLDPITSDAPADAAADVDADRKDAAAAQDTDANSGSEAAGTAYAETSADAAVGDAEASPDADRAKRADGEDASAAPAAESTRAARAPDSGGDSEIRIKRARDGSIAEILIPANAVVSSSPRGLSIRPLTRARAVARGPPP